jgi:hypothetical protein
MHIVTRTNIISKCLSRLGEDIPLVVEGLGQWLLPASSVLPGVYPAPGQPQRSIFVSEEFHTLLVTPPLIVSIREDSFLISDKCVTALPDVTFPQRITTADGSAFVAKSFETVVPLSVTPSLPRQTEPFTEARAKSEEESSKAIFYFNLLCSLSGHWEEDFD